MVINMPKHEIDEADEVQIKEIPIGFINAEENELNVQTSVFKEFINDSKEIIKPYEEFDSEFPILFDDKDNVVTNITLKRKEEKFRYEPVGMTEYPITHFSCSVTIKKHMSYRNDKLYNIKIGVCEADNNLSFCNKVIPFFGNAARRNLCPQNISINNNSMNPASLLENAVEENDFLIYKSPNGIQAYTEAGFTYIDFDEILKSNTNIWLCTDSFDEVMSEIKAENDLYYQIVDDDIKETTLLYDRTNYHISPFEFNIDKENPNFPKLVYNYKLFHRSILLLEKENNGFVIVTPKDIFDDLDNARCIYEVLMYVYLNSYYTTKSATMWITDEDIDYSEVTNKELKKNHGEINLTKLLSSTNIETEYLFSNINIDNSAITFVGLDSNKNLQFAKIGESSDVPKKENEISYLTTKHTVINYKEKPIYKINKEVEIVTEIAGDNIYINVKPILNSSQGVYTNSEVKLKLEDTDIEYYLCGYETLAGIESGLELVPVDIYNENTFGKLIARIRPLKKEYTKLYDTRVFGGGLPEKSPDDYEMLDIGNPYGRPYRIGSTLIIKIPKKYEEYNDRIQSEVKKHISAGDYPVFVYV